VDPWGRRFVYRVTGNSDEVFSVGRNGRADEHDDVDKECAYGFMPEIEPRWPHLVHLDDIHRSGHARQHPTIERRLTRRPGSEGRRFVWIGIGLGVVAAVAFALALVRRD
jgi:hypothetical protein